MRFSTIILSYNSELTIARTIESVMPLSDDIHVVDSFSVDSTLDILRRYPINIVQHPFANYSAQRNWAIDNLPIRHPWELHLDADEQVSAELATELRTLDREHSTAGIDGYCIPRLVCFMGRPLRHGGMYPIWHLRLFRKRAGRCEEREYDQHFLIKGKTSRLRGPIIDDIRMPLSEWIVRHNRWSDAEVRELLNRTHAASLKGRIRGNPIERKRRLRELYDSGPLFVRAGLLFFYRYFLRMGFLDGTPGLIFAVLQAFWFRFLVDAKLYEQRRTNQGLAELP